MMLAEAIAAFELDFAVSDNAGFLVVTEDGQERLAMERAPSGDAYVTLTSGGVILLGEPVPAWYADEDRAVDAWLRQAWAYADKRGGKLLWWRVRPVWMPAEFVATDQAGMIQDERMRMSLSIRVGFVYSRLLVSKGETGKD